jgi:type I restriction enzyme R subunit
MDDETQREFEALFQGQDTILVDPNSLERTFTIPERNRAIVREFRQVLENGFTGKDGVRRFAAEGKTIVFAITKKHAATLAQMFDDAFADKKPAPNIRYADFVVSDTPGGTDDMPDAGIRLKRFVKEDFPKIMVSVNMLDTGFDFPEVVNLAMARFTNSAILYRQMRGRGTRRADHIRKTDFTMFDFVGVTDFHGDDEEEGDGGFVIHYPPPDRPGPPRKLLVLDVHDHIDPTTRGWITLDADGNEVRTAAGEARANDLGVRFEAWLLSRHGLTGDQRRLLKMMGEQIRANALSMENFGAERFTEPPFSLSGGLDRAMQVFGGYSALETMLDELNEAVFVLNENPFTSCEREADVGTERN